MIMVAYEIMNTSIIRCYNSSFLISNVIAYIKSKFHFNATKFAMFMEKENPHSFFRFLT